MRLSIMGLLRDIRDIFRKDRKLFLYVNVYYFGLVLLGALIALAFPQAQLFLINTAGNILGGGAFNPFTAIGDVYRSGNVLDAAAVTFVYNLVLGTLVEITIPSLAVPFWGPILGAVRALEWGIMLIIPVPGVFPLDRAVPHYLTILLEGEAYVVAIFACVRQARVLLKLGSIPADQRIKTYVSAMVDNFKLLPVVALLLAVSALYEAWEVMFFAGVIK
jgi:hypothetical protein